MPLDWTTLTAQMTELPSISAWRQKGYFKWHG